MCDNKIEFWLKNIPYIWTTNKRYYILPKNTTIYDIYGNSTNNLKMADMSTESLFDYSILKFEGCLYVRNFFLVWLHSRKLKNIERRFKELYFGDYDIKIEGKSIMNELKQHIPNNNLKIIEIIKDKKVYTKIKL